MNDELKLKNNLKEARTEKKLSQTQLAEMIGVSRNTISSIETGQFNPTAKLALILCIALDKKFEELFYVQLNILRYAKDRQKRYRGYIFEKVGDVFRRKRMDNIALLILGIFISVIGIVNMTGNISTIHSYNRRKVKEEDVPKYGRAVGTGTLIIGVSLIAAFVTTFWSEKAMSFIVIPALVIGLGFILYAQFKYNKGIF